MLQFKITERCQARYGNQRSADSLLNTGSSYRHRIPECRPGVLPDQSFHGQHVVVDKAKIELNSALALVCGGPGIESGHGGTRGLYKDDVAGSASKTVQGSRAGIGGSAGYTQALYGGQVDTGRCGVYLLFSSTTHALTYVLAEQYVVDCAISPMALACAAAGSLLASQLCQRLGYIFGSRIEGRLLGSVIGRSWRGNRRDIEGRVIQLPEKVLGYPGVNMPSKA